MNVHFESLQTQTLGGPCLQVLQVKRCSSSGERRLLSGLEGNRGGSGLRVAIPGVCISGQVTAEECKEKQASPLLFAFLQFIDRWPTVGGPAKPVPVALSSLTGIGASRPLG